MFYISSSGLIENFKLFFTKYYVKSTQRQATNSKQEQKFAYLKLDFDLMTLFVTQQKVFHK